MKFYFNRKSFTAVMVSAALLLTSVDGMTVRAEELGDAVLPVVEETNPEDLENSENPDMPGDGDNTQEGSSYVKNEQGAVIIQSFEELPEELAYIELEDREELSELTKRMPSELTVYVDEYVQVEQPGDGEDPSGGGGDQPEEGEDQPEEDKPEEGEDQPEEDKPEEGEDQPEGDKPEEGEDQPEEDKPEEGEDQPEEDKPEEGGDQPEEDKPEEGENQPGGGEDQPDADSGLSDTNDVAAACINGTYAIDDGHQWRLLVAAENGINTYDADDADGGDGETGEGGSGDGGDGGNGAGSGDGGDGGNGVGSGDGGDGGEGGNGAGSGEGGDSGSGAGSGDGGGNGAGSGDGGEGGNGAGSGEGGDSGSGAGSGDGGSSVGSGDGGNGAEEPGIDILPIDENEAIPPTQSVSTTMQVTWECTDDYANEDLDEYTFRPKWDTALWFYDENAEGAAVPTIVVHYVEPATGVATEEQLAAAFAAGSARIVLSGDIELTKPLLLPANAMIELDGGGHKLTRGKAEGNSDTFLGIMIDMNGEDYTRDKYGSLTLTDITVDGTAPGDRAGAPVIVDWGKLTLGEGAKVTANYNYGTIGSDETDESGIPEHGGGICVYRELILKDHEQASVTGNYADLLGGGVYLERNAELWLYGDVIKDNMVKAPEDVHGLDLYARPYSKIHYNKDVFGDIRTWPTFCISEQAICIPIGEDEVIPEPADQSKKEIFIAASKDSGYSAKELLELKQKLQELGYKVISNQRTEIDTTDLRNWNVYDHYDSGLWTGGAGGAWSTAYAEYRNRPYYACQENWYTDNPSDPPATTIQKWLTEIEKGNYRWTNKSTTPAVVENDIFSLARFEEHIYSREENGKAAMTFVGYGEPAYTDFCYIDPHSGGEKVVNFDVDSSKVIAHTLHGTGFLINTGEAGGDIKGYIIYYSYAGDGDSGTNARATQLSLYRINDGLKTDVLHNASIYIVTAPNENAPNAADAAITKIASKTITSWDNQMSIKIKVTPDKVMVWQQKTTDKKGEEIDESTPEFFSHALDDTGYSGFGPLAAYNSHACPRATCFTYSNLYMYFTDPAEEERDMMSPLAEADFTQEDTQKYFVNLFGADELEYGVDDFRQYQGYLQMMQEEGIAMITDRGAPFEEYLGSADDPQGEHDPGNLKELVGGGTGRKLRIDDLVRQIDEYMKDRSSTSLKETVGRVLTPADSKQSVGNIWLKLGEEQFRKLDWGQVDGTEYTVQIMDDIACYNSEDVTVTYDLLRPGKSGYINLGEGKQLAFQIKKNRAAWPEGPYTVRQTITEGGVNCAIKGYAYFNLEYPSQYVDPVTYPVTVKVTAKLDGENWTNHGKNFMLQPVGGGTLQSLSSVPEGSYTVCEVVKLASDGTLEEGEDTGVRVDAENADVPNQVREVIVDYCSVKFYDAFPDGKLYGEDTKQAQQNVLKGGSAKVPEVPLKEKYSFIGWVTKDGSAFGPDQFNQIDNAVELYAKWERIEDPRYQVVIEAWKDGGEWKDADRTFALKRERGGDEQFIYDLAHVLNGTYRIYDITGGNPVSHSTRAVSADANVKVGDGDTGVTVKVEGRNVTETVNYYTVTFYDGNKAYGIGTPQRPMIVLKGKKAEKPEKSPRKAGYRFVGWMTAKGGSTKFDFDQPVEKKTDIFARFRANEKGWDNEEISENTPDGGGDMQVVAFSQETESFSQTRTDEKPGADGKEPKTGDTAHVEIYATSAMIAGLTYLLLYFLDEGRGMTEREKEVFVAAFIRWAKKGGRFRRYCAIAAIFCLLVYYHSIGKRAGRKKEAALRQLPHYF